MRFFNTYCEKLEFNFLGWNGSLPPMRFLNAFGCLSIVQTGWYPAFVKIGVYPIE